MPSIGWKLQSRQRLLELSVGGRWYLGFTVGLGVVAIYSGNNVIYLLESLLLSALLVSGALSEMAITRVRVRREIANVHAHAAGEDVFVVENLSKVPLYCLEFGEYLGDSIELSAFLLMLPARATVRVRSYQKIPARGRHRWEGLLVATSFPFGFARKIRFVPDPGNRIVWPQRQDPGPRRDREDKARHGEIEPVADEVVPVEPWQDVSRVHWPLTLRAGHTMARPVRWSEPHEEILLELCAPGPAMEGAISRATGSLVSSRHSVAPALVLLQKGERQRIVGRARALDALALLPRAVVPEAEEDG